MHVKNMDTVGLYPSPHQCFGSISGEELGIFTHVTLGHICVSENRKAFAFGTPLASLRSFL